MVMELVYLVYLFNSAALQYLLFSATLANYFLINILENLDIWTVLLLKHFFCCASSICDLKSLSSYQNEKNDMDILTFFNNLEYLKVTLHLGAAF